MLDWYYEAVNKTYWALRMPKRGTLEEATAEIKRLKENPHPGPDCKCEACINAVNRYLRIQTGDGTWIAM